ncbi:MAG: hypothetical protein PHD29_08160 [bacterium]|nr:hypothetical protein [bacterium]MDD5354045.1 hypothetical protein [bacterium]MDD5756104.1 hypothetical protein [bacterium]
MKNKGLFIVFFGIVLSLIITTTGFAAWPVAIAPSIEGTVYNAVSHKPIENAIVEVEWRTLDKIRNADFPRGPAGYKLIITGKDGKYKIPGKVMLQPLGGVLSRFDEVAIKVRHPLYESRLCSILNKDIPTYRAGGDLKRWNLLIRKLQDKYKYSNVTDKEVSGTYNSIVEDLKEASVYASRAHQIRFKSDWNAYFKTWDKIIEPYKNDVDYTKIKKLILEYWAK